MGLACQFAKRVIESDMAIGEGILTNHYLIQFENYRNGYARRFCFYNRKDSGGNVLATKNKPQQTTG
jgi:hypothetical protein